MTDPRTPPHRTTPLVGPPSRARSRYQRAARRRSLIIATALASFITMMSLVGNGWAFLAGVIVTVAVHHWDMRVRSDPTPIPVIAYTLTIFLVSGFVLAIALVMLAGVLVLLP